MTAAAERREPAAESPPVAAESATRARRRAIVVCVGVGAYLAAYLAAGLFQPPAPLYDPVHRVWVLGRHARGMLMGYFGQVLYAVVGGIVAALIARFATRRCCPGPRWSRAWFSLAVALAACAVAFYATTIVLPLL